MKSYKLFIIWPICIIIFCTILILRFAIFTDIISEDEEEYTVNPYSVNNLFNAWEIAYERNKSHLETFKELGHVFLHPTCAISDYGSDFYYDFSAIEAYESGKLIQDILNKKDLDEIYKINYFGNDIGVYPENYLFEKNPEEIFPEEWIRAIMNSYILCGPFNYSGFMIGSGRVWYHIFKVDGVTRYSIETLNFDFFDL
jgi:hypothetical protein